MRKNVFKATALAITFVICFSSLGTVWGTEHSNTTDVDVASDYEWKLVIDGMVDQRLNLSLSQIVAMPGTKVNADLYCFSSLVFAGNWYGVRIGVLLENAGLLDGVEYIQFVALDGYATFLDISTALRKDVIIAYELNGESLPEILRLVIPYENGDKWVALITQVTAVRVPVSVPRQPNLIPTTFFREAGKSQAASSPQPGDESTPAINESNMPSVVLLSQVPDNSIQFQEFLRTRAAQIIEPDSTEPEPITKEPTASEPATPEPTEPSAEAPLLPTEIDIIAAVAIACIIGAVSFYVLKKRK